MKKSYQISLVVITLLLVCSMLLAGSYALWTLSAEQENPNIIASGCFDATLNGDGDINLENTYPMTDAEGMQTSLYSFTIRNTCSISAAYQVNLETLVGSDLEAEYVNVSFDDGEPTVLTGFETANTIITDSVASKKMTEGVLRPDESVTYTLRLWMNDTAGNEQENKTFESKIIVTLGATATPELKIDFSIGQEVQVLNGDIWENFYVIKDSYENEDIITLLSKYNLEITNVEIGMVQKNAPYTEYQKAFTTSNSKASSEHYWTCPVSDCYEEDGITYRNLNNIENDTAVVINASKEYGKKFGEGVTGRLMTYEEARTLEENYSNILYGRNIGATDDYLNYWLGSADFDYFVWNVRGKDPRFGSSYSGSYFGDSTDLGVRPVIEVSKSLVKSVE